MSLVNLAHVCSHLQNASLARLGLTSIPYTKLHLSLALLLHKQGFLSQVKLGGPSPPASCFPAATPDNHSITAAPHRDRSPRSPEAALYDVVYKGQTEEQLRREGFGEEAIQFALEHPNRASRRLWLGLKYWDGMPVLRKAQMVSKPTKRIWLDSRDLGRLVRGRAAGQVKPITRIGEILAVTTDKGIMDARECVERQIGGMPLCRIW
ncbi:hypothetical protein BAUCODRAFT_73861 [Baudoinia panamericana UAMH 10762]|uniref:Ribosomal protein S8 n=1 Tax=Baudoinia panamericana (strain UAMH 10762) TaxID=717646 RepID=M2N6Q6_BAUPA|nr:uncharacterized protein BAUCODRAFT_73861 [Baudoinia panamericana UAMH 10762]EMC94460.1 hypothetical protein BAUCODRAFT_73861 [Baudoinia panamericana UAMH 10762]